MTAYRVRSTDGNNSDNGSTWALAKLDIAGFAAVDAAGDTAYISQAHAESTAASVTWTMAGTLANPTKLICGNDGADPPTAIASSATVTVTGLSVSLTVATVGLYVQGLTMICGTSGNPSINIAGSNSWQQWENCKFQCGPGTSGGRAVTMQGTSGSIMQWRNVEVKFANATQGIGIQGGYLHWNGGGLTSGGTSPNNLFSLVSGVNRVVIENCDFSAGSSTMNFLNSQGLANQNFVFRNCKLPSSWSGNFATAFSSSGQGRLEVYNCSNSSINYGLKVIDGAGTIDHETTIVKSGGASDGTTSISWKMVAVAGVSYPAAALISPEILFWNDQTGVSKNFAIDIMSDGGLTDADVWIEVNAASSGSSPLGTLYSDRCDVLTAAASQTSSSAGWTTTGIASPSAQKLDVSFTPQAKGWLAARVFLAKASATVYVDPKGTVS